MFRTPLCLAVKGSKKNTFASLGNYVEKHPNRNILFNVPKGKPTIVFEFPKGLRPKVEVIATLIVEFPKGDQKVKPKGETKKGNQKGETKRGGAKKGNQKGETNRGNQEGEINKGAKRVRCGFFPASTQLVRGQRSRPCWRL